MPSKACYSNGHRRRTIRKRIMARRDVCAICGKPIDYSLPAGHPRSFEVDEKVSRWKGGDPLDIRNCQPAHRECNQAKYQREKAEQEAKRADAPSIPKASRKW